MLPYFLDILIAADELALTELIDHIIDYILKKEMFWLRQNLVRIQRIASTHEAFCKLKMTCEEIIQKDSSTFLRSKDIGHLEESILTKLLMSDNLDLKEIEIWNQVIKWGKVKCSLDTEEKDDINNWKTEDFEKLKSSLKDCLPHIRFFLISGADYHDKVRPFKKILSKEVKNELREFYLAGRRPNRSIILSKRLRYTDEESTLIRLKHFSLISSWIDKKHQPYQPESMPYMFKLLYRSGQDELKDINKFYKKCNRHGPTVVLIKPSGFNQIIGGYNADIWNKIQKYDTLANCFIFSLDMNHDDDNDSKGIYSSIKPTVNKVGCTSEKFPWFGNDLNWIKGVCRQQIFEKKIVDYEHFISERVEVYKLFHKSNDHVLYETFYDDSIADDYDFTTEIISEDERPRSQ
ncbi:8834_t:CDS:1 [Funneliformis mosseae]|uniref:8834_t:CDS:1 n=2 Tax=Funneliformis TaxID=1117308 RepID=A0A9N8ZS21_FUNMO|nr:8834_t:CDS:1 [Funneliformis mosseae]